MPPETPGIIGERPLVSFFVTAYRQERLVRASIEAAFAQTWSPLEILLSDDASPDGTFAVMQEMAAAYSGPHRLLAVARMSPHEQIRLWQSRTWATFTAITVVPAISTTSCSSRTRAC